MFSSDNSCPGNGVEEVSILSILWSLSTKITTSTKWAPSPSISRGPITNYSIFLLHSSLATSFRPYYRGPMSLHLAFCQAKTCHVLDYEQQHAELLETSPNYWARKLPEGLGFMEDGLPVSLSKWLIGPWLGSVCQPLPYINHWVFRIPPSPQNRPGRGSFSWGKKNR